MRGLTAGANEAVDHIVEVFHRPAKARALRDGNAVGQDERHVRLANELFHHDSDSLAYAARFSGNVRTKKRFGDDVERGRHELFVDVPRFAVAPSGQHRCGGIGDDARVRDDIFVAERGLDQFALCLPEFSFARQETVAEHRLQSAVVARLQKIRVISYEDLLDAVGMGD
jgi:hypothetical protein